MRREIGTRRRQARRGRRELRWQTSQEGDRDGSRGQAPIHCRRPLQMRLKNRGIGKKGGKEITTEEPLGLRRAWRGCPTCRSQNWDESGRHFLSLDFWRISRLGFSRLELELFQPFNAPNAPRPSTYRITRPRSRSVSPGTNKFDFQALADFFFFYGRGNLNIQFLESQVGHVSATLLI